jgi:hypothetical protein
VRIINSWHYLLKQTLTSAVALLSGVFIVSCYFTLKAASPDGEDEKQEVKFSCKATGGDPNQATARGISLDPANLRDKIGYKVKTDKNGISVKVEYKAEYQEEEGADEFTDTATSFEVKFDSIIEYAKRDGNEDDRSDEEQAYNWDDDLVLQRVELAEFLNFTNITQSGDFHFWHVETVDRMVLFNFTISQAAIGESVTANTMKIDVRIVNFPWMGNDTNLALLSDVKSTLKVEMDYNEVATTERSTDLNAPAADDSKKPPKVHKWARDVVISFEDATGDLGFVPFGDYKWKEAADATTTNDPYGCNQVTSVQRNFPDNDTSICANWTDIADQENVVEETASIRVVGTVAPSLGNDTHQNIAYSFVGPKAHQADVIYWDPEAGIGYEMSGATGWSGSSLFMGVLSGLLYMLV